RFWLNTGPCGSMALQSSQDMLAAIDGAKATDSTCIGTEQAPKRQPKMSPCAATSTAVMFPADEITLRSITPSSTIQHLCSNSACAGKCSLAANRCTRNLEA